MPLKDPNTAVSACLSSSTIQAAQAAVERGEATVAEFDKLVTLDWINSTSSFVPPKTTN